VVLVVWTERAIGDLEDIRTYVAQDRPMAAERLAGRLFRAGNALDQKPDRGRPIGANRRELAHVRPYLIRYRVRRDLVEVLAVRHAARKPG
jgi:plasmid stabilization system protein ParE